MMLIRRFVPNTVQLVRSGECAEQHEQHEERLVAANLVLIFRKVFLLKTDLKVLLFFFSVICASLSASAAQREEYFGLIVEAFQSWKSSSNERQTKNSLANEETV